MIGGAAAVVLAALLLVPRPAGRPEPLAATAAAPAISPAASPRAAADAVLAAITAQDGAALAALADMGGVRFSPAATVDPGHDVRLAPAALAALWRDPARRDWGRDEASGEPILLTGADYAARYLADRDYAAGAEVSLDPGAARGTSVNNIAAVWPGATTVEYFHPGSDASGMDWTALRLVLVDRGGNWRLAGIVHERWTP